MSATTGVEWSERVWLTVEQLNCDRYHGVQAAFLGDDCEAAVAVTGDWRRGAAAIHAMFREATGMPVRAGRVEVVWARFSPPFEEYQDGDVGDWVMSTCGRGDEGATRVVLANGTESYSVGALNKIGYLPEETTT